MIQILFMGKRELLGYFIWREDGEENTEGEEEGEGKSTKGALKIHEETYYSLYLKRHVCTYAII